MKNKVSIVLSALFIALLPYAITITRGLSWRNPLPHFLELVVIEVSAVGLVIYVIMLVLFSLQLLIVKKRVLRTSIKIAMALLVLNIPCWIIHSINNSRELMDSERISIFNESSEKVQNVKLFGTHIDERKIGTINQGEEKTAWVDVDGYTAIQIQFVYDGRMIEETLIDFTGHKMGGHRVFYSIQTDTTIKKVLR